MSFGSAVNCIDGRAQLPVIEWLKFHGPVQYVDVISAPGADGICSGAIKGDYESIHRHLSVSVQVHASSIIGVVGHFDCAGNPVSDEEHLEHIRAAAKNVQEWFPAIRVVGLFVNEYETIDVVCDSYEGDSQFRSFL